VDDRIDERRFGELMVESQDLQSDAMNVAHRDLDNYVEAAQEARLTEPRGRSLLAPALLTAGALGVAGVAFAGSAAAASTSMDVQALQTAAGIENLAVFTYKTALTLPFIGGSSANGVVKAFATMTMAQHAQHAMAFNAAAVKLGGKQQDGTDPKYTPIVQAAVPTIKGPADVVGLAITLEDVAAQTYVADVGLVSTSDLRQLFASVAGVESQHRAILLAVQALLAGNAADLIALPPDATKLPAAAGSVGFPTSFYATSMAAPVTEGALS
jgi:Ferritin-like domain